MLKVIKADSSETRREFLNFPARLYRRDKNYIRPLDKDIEAVFDTRKNKFFRTGECERFLFKNEKTQTTRALSYLYRYTLELQNMD